MVHVTVSWALVRTSDLSRTLNFTAISAQDLDVIEKTYSSELARNKNELFRFKIKDQKLYLKKSASSRYTNSPIFYRICGLLLGAIGRMAGDSDDIEFIIAKGCYPVSIPGVFMWCTRRQDDVGFPSYHESPCRYKKHPELFSVLEMEDSLKNRTSCEHQCIEKVFWRGSCSGKAYDAGFENISRLHVVKLSEDNPDLIDSRVVSCTYPPAVALLKANVDSKAWGNDFHEPMHKITAYRYLLDLENPCCPGCCSGRFSKLLYTGAAVFKYFESGYPWYSKFLWEYVHYVPIKPDLSDLVTQVQWLKNNPSVHSQIQKEALQFSRRTISPWNVTEYTKDFLLAYQSLFKGKVTIEKSDKEVTTDVLQRNHLECVYN